MIKQLRKTVLFVFIFTNLAMVAQDNRFTYWNADGTSVEVKVPYETNQSSDVITNIINVGNAAAVDLSTIAGIMKTTTIGEWIVRTLTYSFEPSTNPNCIYLINDDTEVSEEMAASLEGLNVVKGSEAAHIVLTDGFPFYTPRQFTAANISYERLFAKGNQRRVGGGWQTIVLPFEVQTVSVDNKNIIWFTSKKDDADFWVYKYVGGDDDTALFDYNSERVMSAGTPYIVAVPDASWAGSDCSLEGKTLSFNAENAEVSGATPTPVVSGSQSFIGTYVGEYGLNDAYVLNDGGTNFTSNNSVKAFNAYIQKGNSAGAVVNLAFVDGTETGIVGVNSEAANETNQSVYDMQGRYIGSSVNHLSGSNGQLPKGIYIVNGKKVVIR